MSNIICQRSGPSWYKTKLHSIHLVFCHLLYVIGWPFEFVIDLAFKERPNRNFALYFSIMFFLLTFPIFIVVGWPIYYIRDIVFKELAYKDKLFDALIMKSNDQNITRYCLLENLNEELVEEKWKKLQPKT